MNELSMDVWGTLDWFSNGLVLKTSGGIHTLALLEPYIVMLPDDMMAVEEPHMTQEAEKRLDTELICLLCNLTSMEPMVTLT